MKLKYVVGSPNCRKVHAVIDRPGLSVEFEHLDFFAETSDHLGTRR